MKARIGKLLSKSFYPHPILVAGIGRSGTSVLLNALDLHPLIFPGWGEAPLLRMFGELVERVEYSEAREYYTETLFVPKDYLYRHLGRLCFEYVVGPNYGFDRILASLMGRDFSVLKKRHWCAKVLPKEHEYQGLSHLYPGLAVVHIVRNGIEVVYSRTRFHGFRHLSFEEHCETWAESVEDYVYLNDVERAVQVRHEQLVSEPEALFREIFAFLGIGYDERPAAFVKNNLMIPLDEPTKAGVDVKEILQSREPPYQNWTIEQRATFRRIAGNAMDLLGYEIPF